MLRIVNPALVRRLVAAVLLPVVVGLVGAWVGMAVGGRTTARMGPFDVRLGANFGRGETEIALPPFGHLTANTHRAPLRLTATLWDVDVPALTGRLEQTSTQEIADEIRDDAQSRMAPYALQLTAAALAGAMVLGVLAFRRDRRRLVVTALTVLVAVGGSQFTTWLTYRPAAFRQPSYAGSLALAPQLVGPVQDVTVRIDEFRSSLQRVVDGAVRAYTAIEPSAVGGESIRVLHISDIHLSPLGLDFARQLARGFDVHLVLDTGDLTSYGTAPEELILNAIPRFDRPYVFVRGNHDSPELAEAMDALPNATVLDGTTQRFAGLWIYGLAHPAFTEDRTQDIDHARFVELARGTGPRIAQDLEGLERPPDIVAVHDDRMAEAVAGTVPLVVSGHYHRPSTRVVDGTRYLRGGTTGGAGVNVFMQTGGVPLQAQILYFERSDPPQLLAWDRIEQSPETGSLEVRRHLVPRLETAIPEGIVPPDGASPD